MGNPPVHSWTILPWSPFLNSEIVRFGTSIYPEPRFIVISYRTPHSNESNSQKTEGESKFASDSNNFTLRPDSFTGTV